MLEDAETFTPLDNTNASDLLNEEVLYVIKKGVIIEEWRRRCYQIERKRRIEEKSVFRASNAKNRLFRSLQKLVKREQRAPEIKKSMGFMNKEAAKIQQEVAQKLKVGFVSKLGLPVEQDTKGDQIEGIDMSDYKVSEIELSLVNEFMSKFTIVTEESMNEHIDILLMLKAMPNKISLHNFK